MSFQRMDINNKLPLISEHRGFATDHLEQLAHEALEGHKEDEHNGTRETGPVEVLPQQKHDEKHLDWRYHQGVHHFGELCGQLGMVENAWESTRL